VRENGGQEPEGNKIREEGEGGVGKKIGETITSNKVWVFTGSSRT